MPPSSYRLPYTTRMAPELAEGAPNGGDGGGLDEPDAPFGACCCLFRSLSLMELWVLFGCNRPLYTLLLV